MEGFPVELFYVLAFLGFILFNYIAQRAARRRRQEEAAAQEQAAAQAEPPPAEDEPLEDIWGRAPTPAPAPRPVLVLQPIPAAPAASSRRTAPRGLFRSKQDLRHAIVVMTVLGSCRALEPDDRRQTGPAARGTTPNRS